MAKLHQLANEYSVDLKKIMGVNVAFDITDNTDELEPTHAVDMDKMLDPVLD